MYQSIPKPPIPSPGHLTFLKDFGQIPWYVGNLVDQMPRWLELQKASKSPTHQVVIKATFQKISHASNRLFKCKYPTKHDRKSQKLSYGALFISIKLFVSESPHFTGWQDLIFSEIPHCMELNSSQIPRVYGVGGGGDGWERLELTGT